MKLCEICLKTVHWQRDEWVEQRTMTSHALTR